FDDGFGELHDKCPLLFPRINLVFVQHRDS
ncbi:MAG: hypothetical protein ACI9OF_002874, partial [Saprospiraceae bacterium]